MAVYRKLLFLLVVPSVMSGLVSAQCKDDRYELQKLYAYDEFSGSTGLENCHKVCQNGASCTVESRGLLPPTTYCVCTCLPGYTGEKCETDIDDCASKPCQNSGKCIDFANDYGCSCKTGYYGHNCETKTNECAATPCQHEGTCIALDADYECKCQPGYTGKSCETDMEECSSTPCLNGGTCVDKQLGYDCQCMDGYSGDHCEHSLKNCFYKWKRSNSTRVGGVRKAEQRDTEESCKEACLEMKGCYGVDYYYSNKTCWFQYTNNPPRVVDTISVHLDWNKTCPEIPCKSIWTRYAQKRVGIGIGSQSGLTEESCRQACVDTEGCTGVDYYKQQNGLCWFLIKRNQAMYTDIGSIHYELNFVCPGIDCPLSWWERYPQETSVKLPTKKEVGHTEETCKAACLYTTACMSVDFYKDLAGTCYFGFVTNTDIKFDESSVHLDINRTCPDCDYVWNRHTETSTKGLTYSETGHTEESCKQACFDTSVCYYVNYYPETKTCWFGYDENGKTSTNSASIHLTISQHCPALRCESKWTRYPETKVQGITDSETGHSEKSCEQACDDTAGCTSVNYYKEPSGTCWFGFTSDQEKVADKDSVYLQLAVTCPESETMLRAEGGPRRHRLQTSSHDPTDF